MASTLSRYLDDHLAAAFAAERVVRSALRNRPPPHIAARLGRFRAELREDRRELMRVQRALGLAPSRVKLALGNATGIASGLGSRERLLRYTPYSLLLQLEGLVPGIQGKLCLWRTLSDLVEEYRCLHAFDLAELARRAIRQRRDIEQLRREVAAVALARHEEKRMPAHGETAAEGPSAPA